MKPRPSSTPIAASITASIASALAAISIAGAAFANDNCASPTQIAGSGVFAFDLSGSTMDAPGIYQCASTPDPFAGDHWFCWTSDVDGMVTITTCGLTDADTGIAIYPDTLGCGCPGDLPPHCCNDDAGGSCGKQSKIDCEVKCGNRYMIQIAARQSGFPPVGQFQIETNGQPCDGGSDLTPPECGACCGTRPPLVDSLATPFPAGQVGAVTFGIDDSIAGNIGVLRLVGLGDQTGAPFVGSGSLWTPPEYAHPQWSLQNLGGIFGVTFDGQGNIFVAQSVVYGVDVFGALGVSGSGDGRGAIYRIDGATGVPTLFRTLPQAAGVGQSLGIGNLDFDCQRNRLFATNLEDGRIYSIDAGTGAISTFDHATGTVESESSTGNGDAIAEGPNPGGTSSEPAGFPGYGSAPYAVKVAGSRVYYSVWEAYGVDQTVHSVEIDSGGAFIAGTERLELTIPYAPGHPYANVNCPITDISFDPDCCMLLAERSMNNPSSSSAHNSRAWRACFDAASASWTAVRYDIGSLSFSTDFQNSSGGIDFVDGLNGPQAWLTGDFFSQGAAGSYYGIGGVPLIDANPAQLDTFAGPGVNMTGAKSRQGSLDITCFGATSPCEFSTMDIDCRPNADGTMDFVWTIEITNNSGSAANLLILSDPAFAPNNVIALDPPLAPGSSMSLDLPITGAEPGSYFCFTATLAASYKDACCTEEICLVLPECTCLEGEATAQDVPGADNFSFMLDVTNLTPFPGPAFPGEWISLSVVSGTPATLSPTLIDIPTLAPLASTTVGPIAVNTALPPGSVITVIVGIHSSTFHPCCFREIEVVVPSTAGSATPGDLNGDGVVNASDLAAVLSNWGMAGATDVNHDGTTDAQDLAILLANWS